MATIFNESQNFARFENFLSKKYLKTFQRASACVQMFLAVIKCLDVLAKVSTCTFVYALLISHVFTRNAQQTDSCVFQCARSLPAPGHFFVLACGAPCVLIPKLTEQ